MAQDDAGREPAFPTSIIGPRLRAGLEAAGVKPDEVDWKTVLELLASCLPTPEGQLEVAGGLVGENDGSQAVQIGTPSDPLGQ